MIRVHRIIVLLGKPVELFDVSRVGYTTVLVVLRPVRVDEMVHAEEGGTLFA